MVWASRFASRVLPFGLHLLRSRRAIRSITRTAFGGCGWFRCYPSRNYRNFSAAKVRHYN
jgi:hypothetical protein